MMKVMMTLVFLTLAGSLYAGEACCSKDGATSTKTEKKTCTSCKEKEDGAKCEACKVKKVEKADKK